MKQSQLVFQIHISQDEFLLYYQGAARSVYTRAIDGRTVRFPASLLRPFLTHEGINGVFALSYDDDNKFKEIKRLS